MSASIWHSRLSAISFSSNFRFGSALSVKQIIARPVSLLIALSLLLTASQASALEAAPHLQSARQIHTATLLSGDKLLVVGGTGEHWYGFIGYVPFVDNSVELFDSATQVWTNAAPLAFPRNGHTATRLANGKVLVAGGQSDSMNLAHAELYNPATNSWTQAGIFSQARDRHTATLLANGKVLIAGGHNGTVSAPFALSTASLYTSSTNLWTYAAPLAMPRYDHTATKLGSGKVLVVGGWNPIAGGPVSQVELFDPMVNTWTTVDPLQTARSDHTATLLPNGKVLVVGGTGNAAIASAEVFDPATNTWTAASPLAAGRAGHTATLLRTGHVLVAGGKAMDGFNPVTELYDPATDTWMTGTSLTLGRDLHTATLMLDGVLMVGGRGFDPSALYPNVTHPLRTNELYRQRRPPVICCVQTLDLEK